MAYRQNVCAAITDGPARRVLLFRRVDSPPGEPRWQLPQGGVSAGESHRDAMLRELREEIGTDRVEIVAVAPRTVRYDYPAEVRHKLARNAPERGRFEGQEQTWFRCRLLGEESSIRFGGSAAEFDAFRWVTPGEALALIVPFKAEAYRDGFGQLDLLTD